MGIILGAGFFLSVYGIKILDPTFIDWTMEGDAAAHFLGWHFFRSEPWTFPLGKIRSYYFPHGTSLVFTDSIPLLAIPLKVFSPFLPSVFQYHGIWIFLCFILQGLFAAILLRRITTNSYFMFWGILLCLLSPVMFIRSGGHESLSAHWVILAALYLYFLRNTPRTSLKWLLLLVITTLIHFYLLAMVICIGAGFILKCFLENDGDIKSLIKMGMVNLLAIVIVMWSVGYFIFEFKYVFGQWGHFSMNLLSPFNPSPYPSTFSKTIQLATSGQYEGFNYLGVGLLLMIMISLYEISRNRSIFVKTRDLPLFLISLFLLLLSVSDKITIGDLVILDVRIPFFSRVVGGLVRASGRLFWPIFYMIILFTFAIIVTYHSRKRAIVILIISSLLQFVDFLPILKMQDYVSLRTWETPLRSPLWEKMIEGYDHVAFVPPDIDGDDYVPFAFLAATFGKTINVGNVARKSVADHQTYHEKFMQEFKNMNIQSNTMYIVGEGHFFKPPPTFSGAFGVLDGFPILVANGEELIKELDPLPFVIIQDGGEITIKEIIESHSRGYIILISVKGEVSNKIPTGFINIMKKRGSQIRKLGSQGSYGAIFHNGNLLEEKVDNQRTVEIKFRFPTFQIEVESSGLKSGNRSIIRVNEYDISPNKRGFNIVVIEEKEKRIFRYLFDTHAFENPKSKSL